METFLPAVSYILTDILWPLVQFLIGLNLVVFIHEMGHFMAARWAGIKVERFALGMGPRLFGIVRGETDFCICALPLGGYVKMLGQEDFAPQEDPDKAAEDGQEQPAVDPRSFNAATVGKRMVVISAGVVMNVILAAILFVIVCMIGKDYPAPVVGAAAADFPASKIAITWEGDAPPAAANPNKKAPNAWVGLQPGDTILSLDGDPVDRFIDIQMVASLADKGETFPVTFRRKIDGKEYIGKATMGVKLTPQMDMPKFGIVPATTLVVSENPDTRTSSPFQADDKIVAIDGKKISRAWQLEPIKKNLTSKPVEVTVERLDKTTGKIKTITFTEKPFISCSANVLYLADGKRLKATILADNPDKKQEIETETGRKLTVDPSEIALKIDGKTELRKRDEIAGGGYFTNLDILGMTPRLRICSMFKSTPIERDTPAEAAGLQIGDITQRYGDRPTPTLREFLDISKKTIGNKTRITVLRDGKNVSMEISPREKNGQALVGVGQSMDLEHLVVASVRKGSPAAKAGVVAGAELKAINGQKIHSWIDLLEALKKLQGQEITITARLGNAEKTYKFGKLTKNDFQSDDYKYVILKGVDFRPLMTTIKHDNPLAAISWGTKETYRLVASTYQTLSSLFRGSVSTNQLRGPVGIGQVAIMAARHSLLNLVYLMAVISAAVAAFNFLPLPVLDGGHAVLLIAEKLRGKPLPIKIVNIIQMAGLVLILGLFVALTWQDIARIVSGWF
ncbi:MAG: site-2 protease family protein [Phycisphaerae bacterium]|nr:site-2 protease family protein [Phycisphaerae bacterium]